MGHPLPPILRRFLGLALPLAVAFAAARGSEIRILGNWYNIQPTPPDWAYNQAFLTRQGIVVIVESGTRLLVSQDTGKVWQYWRPSYISDSTEHELTFLDWQQLANQPLMVSQVDSDVFYAACPGGIARSDDGCRSWRFIPSSLGDRALLSFYPRFISRDSGWCYTRVDDIKFGHWALAKTVDGGQTWRRQDSIHTLEDNCEMSRIGAGLDMCFIPGGFGWRSRWSSENIYCVGHHIRPRRFHAFERAL